MQREIPFNQLSLEQSVVNLLINDLGSDKFYRNLSIVDADMIQNKTLHAFVSYSKSQVKKGLPVDLDQFLYEVVDKNPSFVRGDIDLARQLVVTQQFDSYISQLNRNFIHKLGCDKIRELHHNLSSGTNDLDVLTASQDLYRELLSKSGTSVPEAFSSDTDSFMEDLSTEWMYEQQGIGRVKIGLQNYDGRYAGFKSGELIILGARPSMGKTSMALTMALGALKSKSKYPVVIFSGEMSPLALKKKLIAMYSFGNSAINDFVPLSALTQFENFEAHRDNIHYINEEMKRLFENKLIIVDSIGKGIDFIHKELAKVYNKYGGINIAFLDYIQIVKLEGKKSRHEEIADVSMSCKIMANEMNCPFVVLAQLNRELERRENKRPLPSDLKDSGSIEQDADVILFVYRDSVYRSEALKQEGNMDQAEALLSEPLDTTELIVGKNRNGPTGTVLLKFHRATTRFIDEEIRRIDVTPPAPSSRSENITPTFDASIVNSSVMGVVRETKDPVVVAEEDLLTHTIDDTPSLDVYIKSYQNKGYQ